MTPDRPIPPEEILNLSPERADRLFDQLDRGVTERPALLDLSRVRADEAIVFGDSHGDWRSVVRVVEQYRQPDRRRLLIGLGDYVDRCLADCGAGGVANALYLLQLAAADPDGVVLLRGNHETVRLIPFHPESVRGELHQLWGPGGERYDRLIDLLGRGPLAAFHSAGPYFAHGGFPRGDRGADWKASFDRVDERLVAEVTWADCAASINRRGAAPAFDEADITEFLERSALTFMLRGHDPDLTGRRVLGERCLTLHTTRFYERYGGVIFARVPLDRPHLSLRDVRVEHVDTEGQRYGVPVASGGSSGLA